MESAQPSGGDHRVRYVLDVGPGDHGVRISLRRRLAEGGYGDVLGELLCWDQTRVQVRRRDGSVVELAPADVVAARRVPPAPERRR